MRLLVRATKRQPARYAMTKPDDLEEPPEEGPTGTPRSGLHEALSQASAVSEALQEAMERSAAQIEHLDELLTANQRQIGEEFDRAQQRLNERLEQQRQAALSRSQDSFAFSRRQMSELQEAAEQLAQSCAESASVLSQPELGDESAREQLNGLNEATLQARCVCRAGHNVLWPASGEDVSVKCDIQVGGEVVVEDSEKAEVPGWFQVVAKQGCWVRAGVELKSSQVIRV